MGTFKEAAKGILGNDEYLPFHLLPGTIDN
jgi:hypothetical protein